MVYINPIEILELKDESVNLLDSNVIRKAKRKLFAKIDLSDDGLLDYYEQKLTKSDCERIVFELEDPNKFQFYYHLARNHVLNSFLANGNMEFLVNPKLEGIFIHPEFINFISPYLSKKIDSLLLKAFQNKDLELFSSLIRILYLIGDKDVNNAYRSISNEIEQRIIETDKLTKDIKECASVFTDEDVESILGFIADKFPIEYLNKLPEYFQSQINKIASSINYLQLNIWNEFGKTIVSLKLLEHLLSLNIESVNKPTFERNYEIVKKEFLKRREEEKLQLYIDKLFDLLNSFENKIKNIANARELLFEARPCLFNLKVILKDKLNTYYSLSTRVATMAQTFIIEDVNNQSSYDSIDKVLRFPTYKDKLVNAWEVMELIGSLEMQNDFLVNRYNPNKETLKVICSKYNVSTPQLSLDKFPKCSFVIVDCIITHTNKDSNPLQITDPLIRGNIRYIGLNLKIEAFDNQTVKFNLKYIQPNGVIKTGTSSPEGITYTINRTIYSYSETINLSGWGNNDKGIYEVGTHYIEVWMDNCMICRKSFVVDWSIEEKIENAKREAEKRERERIEAEERKKQARIYAQKIRERKVRNICLWIIGIFIGLAVIFSIWGKEGLETIGTIFLILAVLFVIGWVRVILDNR